ncbi:Cytochrome c6 [Defluviimonas aquaemixtae]|uniref:Cytochrome c6 n=1 Tax=Albidovulum aquaemixtae TaxID=1542388 RepID=A0A2R8BNJ4_9RHOB|nr:cytochrome c [Defluviimonas aquaemixtae]SPH25011.1 Cytochrome c6 [Defluviimonas aquaemixtae]
MAVRIPLATAGGALIVALQVLLGAATAVRGQDATGPADIAEGERLCSEFCASCHGADLEGQTDWRSPDADGRLPAPPHDDTGHTWHHGEHLLFDYTKLGGKTVMAAQGLDFDSGMPAFAEELSDQEIRNILAFIKSTWPERLREMQAIRTEAERLLDQADR